MKEKVLKIAALVLWILQLLSQSVLVAAVHGLHMLPGLYILGFAAGLRMETDGGRSYQPVEHGEQLEIQGPDF